MLAKISLVSLLSFVSSGYQGDDQWSISYDVYEYGPRTVYEGRANLHFDENTSACLSYSFDLAEGCLGGSSISSDPGKPMLPFDSWERNGDELMISWCRDLTDFSDTPTQIPRNFAFHIIKTQFNADDLGKLLSEWGPPAQINPPWPEKGYTLVSSWDLNADTMVDGKDLVILLAGWKIQ